MPVKLSFPKTQQQDFYTTVNKKVEAGTYTTHWNADGMAKGSYFISGNKDGGSKQSLKVVKE